MSNLSLVKPEKARQVEDMIIRNMQMGAYKEKISEGQLIGLLEEFNDQQETKIKFKRKIDEDEDDDDLAGL